MAKTFCCDSLFSYVFYLLHIFWHNRELIETFCYTIYSNEMSRKKVYFLEMLITNFLCYNVLIVYTVIFCSVPNNIAAYDFLKC